MHNRSHDGPVDHSHGPESSISDDADPLYQPLSSVEPRVDIPIDEAAWAEAVDRLRAAREAHPDWGAMVERGALLAAAHQSGALDGMHGGARDLALALLRGEAPLAALDDGAQAHVRANAAALRLAADVEVSDDAIRRIHEVACRPQLTHRVRVGEGVRDHVLAAGDYKHHPNHVLDEVGHWRPTAPVARVPSEMAALVDRVRSPAFSGLHPVVQAAWLHDALMHVQPFADGNGRVARALAGGCLLRAASIPFLVFADDPDLHSVDTATLVQRAGIAFVDLLTSTPPEGPALDRWRTQEAAGDALRRGLIPALELSLARPDGARRADLSAAVVVPGEPVVVRVPLDDGRTVEEVIGIEAHPEDGEGPVVATAREAALRLEAGQPLDPWVDRVVSILALRVAAELEEPVT